MINLENITKTYKVYDKQTDRFWEALSLKGKKRHRDFHALKNVSLQVAAGKSVGLIGVNGSGKSTLLQIIAGVLTPSAGSRKIAGRVSALLELGAGFNPEYTGLENVAFQCDLLGIPRSKQASLIEAIVAFAGIGEFVKQPVKTYSSGMYVRLAFAAAINVDPDILIVDEALAVGDIQFQSKCLRKIREFKNAGKTLLFVSHDANAVKALCDEAHLLNAGELIYSGTPDQVVKYYNNMLALKDINDETLSEQLAKRSGNGRLRITNIQMLNHQGLATKQFYVGEAVKLVLTVTAYDDVPSPTVGMSIHDRLGIEMFGINNYNLGVSFPDFKKHEVKTIEFGLTLNLGINTYSVSASCHPQDTHLIENYDWVNDALVFKVDKSPDHWFVGSCLLPSTITCTDSGYATSP